MSGIEDQLPADQHDYLEQLQFSRRRFFELALLAGASYLVSACTTSSPTSAPARTSEQPTSPVSSTPARTSELPTTLASSTPEQLNEQDFLHQAANSLLDLHAEGEAGWRFQSQIQAPHYQTDRDVGAASVGMGFLVMDKQEPHDPRWLDAANKTADWLMAVSKQDNHGGRFWPDYSDDAEVSQDVYTSFDDGAIGIGDFFWQLYERTQDAKHQEMAVASLEWTFSRAENIGKGENIYRWQWNANDNQSPYYMGMGEGAVGTIHTLTSYYERLKNTNPAQVKMCKTYIDGSLRYLDMVRQALDNNSGDGRAIPETGVIGQDGDTTMNSGYLSGAAGAAFMYLKLYQVFGDKNYLTKADELFSWLEDAKQGPLVDFGDGTAAWKLSLDPQGGDNPIFATGMEEGNAGIGWTYLQAYNLIKQEKYLVMAKKAADWLLKVALKDRQGGLSWHEDESPVNPLIHANLNNGAAGIGMFLEDLYQATNDPKYHQASQGALNWITASAARDGNDIYWNDNGGEAAYSKDPSWHWGTAGILAFVARMHGGTIDIAGEQPGLPSRLAKA